MDQGWVALVGPEIEENLSLRYLASALRRTGVRVELFPFNTSAALPKLVEALTAGPPPLLMGLSLAFQWRAPDLLALAMALREGGCPAHLTVGGHFATFACLELLQEFQEIDSVCRHESEDTLTELVTRLLEGRGWRDLEGLAVRDDTGAPRINPMRATPDLATLPWPDRRGEPAACFGHRVAPLISTRGCYANCSFCSIAAWHEQVLPGKRYRERPLEDVADEMAWLHHERDIELFVFHDDNFFLASGVKNAQRIDRLADLLEARGVRRFGTVVKARPTDVQPHVFERLVKRLNCLRCYVGIETDSDQGLATLNRWAKPRHNREALALVDRLGLYVCFNVLLFDPDTTLETLEENLAFMHEYAEYPFNFARTELYAGTPLLARMQAEGRAVGDWLQWDYTLHDEAIERVFAMTAHAFFERNFASDGLATSLMGTRFDVECCRHFHAPVYQPRWLEASKGLSRALGRDSVQALRSIIAHVRSEPKTCDVEVAEQTAASLRDTERALRDDARALAAEISAVVGQGAPLTDLGDKVATPLQRARAEVLA